MRQWSGVIDNAAPVGDGFENMSNVSMRVRGSIRRRSTLSDRIATSLTVLRMAAHDSLGNEQVSPPLSAPTALLAAGGLGTNGVHLIRYRYYDTFLGVASAPSPSVSITLGGGNNQFTVTMIGTQLADGYILEITQAGGSTFYQASGVVPTGSFSFTFGSFTTANVSVADATLAVNGVFAGTVSTSSAAGSWILCGTASTVIGVNLVTDVSTTCLSSLTNSTYRPTYGYINQVTYVNNGVDPMQRISRGDTAGTFAGIVAPSAAPSLSQGAAGTVTDGTHLVRYRYWDQLRNRYSDPSPSASITMAQSDLGTLTAAVIGTAQTGVERIILEMTLADGTEFYIAAYGINTLGASNIVVTMSDQVLAVQTPANVYAGPDGFGHGMPPVCRLLAAHRSRLFQWAPTTGNTRDLLYWSRVGLPESWKPAEWARTGTLVSGDSPAAILPFQDDLYLIGRRSMTRLIYTSDPSDGILTQLPTNLGAFNQACVLAVDSDVYGFGRNGMWRIHGIMPENISDPIDDLWQAEMDFSFTDDCFVCYDGLDKVIRFFYTVTDSRGNKCACYHLETDMWTFDTFLNELSHGVQASTAIDNTYLYLSEGVSYAGDLWQMRLDGKGDGFDSTVTTGAFTAAAGSTTTVVNTSQTMTASAYVGAYLYVPSTGESRRITANTTNTITVPALSGAPAAGIDLWIGSVSVEILPFWSSLAGTEIGRTRSNYLMMENVNDEAAPTFAVRFYADYSSSAFTLTNNGSDTPPQGVTIVNGTNYATVDMSLTQGGVCAVPVMSTWNRVVRYKITQQKPDGVIKLMDARWVANPKDIRPERSQA